MLLFMGVPVLPGFVIVFFQPCPDLLDVLLQGGHVLFFLFGDIVVLFCPVRLPMAAIICRITFSIFSFFLVRSSLVPLHSFEALEGASRRRWQELLADEVQLVTDEEDFEKERDDLLAKGRDEVGYRGEVRPGIAGEAMKTMFSSQHCSIVRAGGDTRE